MAVNSAITAPPPAADGFRAQAAGQSLRRGAERLNRLVQDMESIAAELDSPSKSRTERTVLRARFNDLQRQVNELDGIVAAEGFESSGQDRVARAADGPSAERTSRTQVPRSSEARAPMEASAPPQESAEPPAPARPAPQHAADAPADDAGPAGGTDTEGSKVDLLA
jgi:hypothetical protein